MKNKDALFTSNKDDWSTPTDFFEALNQEFSFTLDPCSDEENYKCSKHYTKNDDGLKKDWGGDSFLQPTLWQKNIQMGREMLLGRA